MTRCLPFPAVALVLAPLLLLGSCGKSSAPQAASTASGEILQGSVSDAMLNTDRSQAEAPLAPVSHSLTSKTAADPGDGASEAATGADSIAAPAQADDSTPPSKPAGTAKTATP